MNNEQRKAITKLTIEQAATILFSQKPFESVSMNEISAKAGLSKRTIYKYFPSKYALLSAVFEHYQQKHYTTMVQALSKCDTPKEIMTAAVKTTFEYTKENLYFMRLLWSVNDDQWIFALPVELSESILGWNNMLFNYVAGQFKKIKLKKGFEAYSPELLTHYMSAVNKGIFIQVHKGTSHNLAAVAPEELMQMALDYFLNSIDD